MKAIIIWSSNVETNPNNVKEFNSLEELLNFRKQMQNDLIISESFYWDEKWGLKPDFQIEVYDYYRE